MREGTFMSNNKSGGAGGGVSKLFKDTMHAICHLPFQKAQSGGLLLSSFCLAFHLIAPVPKRYPLLWGGGREGEGRIKSFC